ncbi:hypothetical protein OEZ60_14185 [Defluviimonas sp. WL0024]|uniref:NAD(P)/FAD-dependent oxidoreductase n=1 Tax=Albidovulum salinarum TaxID=2984153 RepID=A0ABT2X5C8_9RHOB|nr:hypothetical protein [Defluviimonas sp. WL0024]MCU9849152.1 hypothetical protein [Defluviimonas sp. WL0024]
MSDAGIAADYVVIGAAAMAFTDTLLTETDATLVMVDRRPRPGGHWNDAYPFVRLHSAATFYGVNSAPLGEGRIDRVGWNSGHLELSSGAAICGYFDDVMRHRFLASGRVTFLPSHEYGPGGFATSRLTGSRTILHARRRIVDGTHADTRLPSTHPPSFPIAPSVRLVTPDALPGITRPATDFVIIGGGKTAIDCVLWLLEQDLPPERIFWIRPRDSWFYNRKRMQPQSDVAAGTIEQYVIDMESARDAKNIDDLFRRLETKNALLRIDPEVTPTMFHCATVTEAELSQLRRVRNVIRKGRVTAIEPDRIMLEHGEIPTGRETVHVHCAASGVPVRPSEPVFQHGRIVLQFIQHCWPTFSAAAIALLEARRSDDAVRNRLAVPVRMADRPIDWLRGELASRENEALWFAEPDLAEWSAGARVDGFTRLFLAAEKSPDPALRELVSRLEAASGPGIARIRALLEAAGRADHM